ERSGHARHEGEAEGLALALEIVAATEQRLSGQFAAILREGVARRCELLDIVADPALEIFLERFDRGFGATERGHVDTGNRTADFRLQNIWRHEDFDGMFLAQSRLLMRSSSARWHRRRLCFHWCGVRAPYIPRARAVCGKGQNNLSYERKAAEPRPPRAAASISPSPKPAWRGIR